MNIASQHYRDDCDNPKGGFSGGHGIAITWNDVPGSEEYADPAEVIVCALDRLVFLVPHRPSIQKERAINHLRSALKELGADEAEKAVKK